MVVVCFGEPLMRRMSSKEALASFRVFYMCSCTLDWITCFSRVSLQIGLNPRSLADVLVDRAWCPVVYACSCNLDSVPIVPARWVGSFHLSVALCIDAVFFCDESAT